MRSRAVVRRLQFTTAALSVAVLGLAACSSSEPEAEVDAEPVAATADSDGDDGDVFTPGDSETSDAAASSGEPADDASSAGTDEPFTSSEAANEDTATQEPASGSEPDADLDTNAEGNDVSANDPSDDDTQERASDDPVTELTPEEIEEAGPIDAETRDVLEEAEEEFRNRPDAEPGELALENADFVFETRFLGGDFIGTVGTVDVPVGSMVAFNLVTDVVDDVVVLDSDVTAPTNGDSALIVFVADVEGDFVIALENTGTELLRVNAS